MPAPVRVGPPQKHYEESGVKGLDYVSINPSIGGDPTLSIKDQLWTFAMPRRVRPPFLSRYNLQRVHFPEGPEGGLGVAFD